MSTQDILSKAQAKIEVKLFSDALRILKPLKNQLGISKNPQLLQTFADCYMETNKLEKAYDLLIRLAELDPSGEATGNDKFFILGQIVGGIQGLNYLTQGIQNISSGKENLEEAEVEKVVSGILTMIDIWMTDLCMEENAEAQCEELINKAMEFTDQKSPEAWSVLGSIRISQQRFNDAGECFVNAWNFFQVKKQYIETLLGEGKVDHDQYMELIQPLLNCSKMCIEMGLYDISLEILNSTKDIDEDNLEALYLEGFTNYLKAKVIQLNLPIQTPEQFYEFNTHIEESKLNYQDAAIEDLVYDAKVAFSMALKLGENTQDDEIVKEILAGTNNILFNELGGPIDDKELMEIRKGAEVIGDEQIEIPFEQD